MAATLTTDQKTELRAVLRSFIETAFDLATLLEVEPDGLLRLHEADEKIAPEDYR